MMKKIIIALAATLAFTQCSMWAMKKNMKKWKQLTTQIADLKLDDLGSISESKEDLMACFHEYGLGNIKQKTIQAAMKKLPMQKSIKTLWKLIHENNADLKPLLVRLKLIFLERGSFGLQKPIEKANQPKILFRKFMAKKIPDFVNTLDENKLANLEKHCPADLSRTKPINLLKISMGELLRERIEEEEKLSEKDEQKNNSKSNS